MKLKREIDHAKSPGWGMKALIESHGKIEIVTVKGRVKTHGGKVRKRGGKKVLEVVKSDGTTFTVWYSALYVPGSRTEKLLARIAELEKLFNDMEEKIGELREKLKVVELPK